MSFLCGPGAENQYFDICGKRVSQRRIARSKWSIELGRSCKNLGDYPLWSPGPPLPPSILTLCRWECAQGMGEEHLYSRRSTHRRVWTGQDGSELSDDRFTFVNARVISRFEFIKTTTREQSELRMG